MQLKREMHMDQNQDSLKLNETDDTSLTLLGISMQAAMCWSSPAKASERILGIIRRMSATGGGLMDATMVLLSRRSF